MDFRSGHGGFLEQAKNIFKDICGYEVSQRTCNSHNKAGWHCYSFLEDLPTDREIILLFHVLEYIPNTQQFLGKLQDNFPKAKTFIIEVPNDNEALISLFENDAYRKTNIHLNTCSILMLKLYEVFWNPRNLKSKLKLSFKGIP